MELFMNQLFNMYFNGFSGSSESTKILVFVWAKLMSHNVSFFVTNLYHKLS